MWKYGLPNLQVFTTYLQIKAPHQLEHISSAKVGSPSNSRTPCEKNMCRRQLWIMKQDRGKNTKKCLKFHHPGCLSCWFHVCLHLRFFGRKGGAKRWPYVASPSIHPSLPTKQPTLLPSKVLSTFLKIPQ